MRWRKRGLIFVPDGRLPWAQHHAFPPTPYALDDRRLRVYVAFCDARHGRACRIRRRAARAAVRGPAGVGRPVLDIGAPGAFDDNGVVPTCAVRVGDEIRALLHGLPARARRRRRTRSCSAWRSPATAGSRSCGIPSAPVLGPSDAETTTRGSAHVAARGRRLHDALRRWLRLDRARRQAAARLQRAAARVPGRARPGGRRGASASTSRAPTSTRSPVRGRSKPQGAAAADALLVPRAVARLPHRAAVVLRRRPRGSGVTVRPASACRTRAGTPTPSHTPPAWSTPGGPISSTAATAVAGRASAMRSSRSA